MKSWFVAIQSRQPRIVKEKEIDLAILNFQMPAMNGAELAALCKAEHPEIKAILFSGHLAMRKFEFACVDLFVAKSEGVVALLEGSQRATSLGRNPR